MSEESLFSRIGGQAKLDRIVEMVIDKATEDVRLRNRFRNKDVGRIKEKVKQCLGPVFKGEPMPETSNLAEAHRDLGVTTEEFDLLVSFFDKVAWEAECTYDQSRQVAAMIDSLRESVTRK